MPRLLTILMLSLSSLPAVASFEAVEEGPVPVLQLDFADLPSGGIVFDGTELSAEGATSPTYGGMPPRNSALSIGRPGGIQFREEELADSLDFDSGDTLTVEAWVNPSALNGHAAIISKGRTGSSGPKALNQNWAVRLSNSGGIARLNFLFRSRASEGRAGGWHRWTADSGFAAGSGWHHVVLSYTFGDSGSIRGWTDSRPVAGKWDMDGPTDQPPVVDDDDVLVGSTMNRNAGNAFIGLLDEIRVYRGHMAEERILAAYQFTPPPVEVPEIPAEKVLAQFLGPFSGISGIPRVTPAPSLSWTQDDLVCVQMPSNFDEYGVRDGWARGKAKVMLTRLWSRLQLPPGDYELILRTRGYAELRVGHELLLSAAPQKNRSGAHHVVDPLPEQSAPGTRYPAMSDQEHRVVFRSDGEPHIVRLDLLSGGPSYRLEYGETCLAVRKGPEEIPRILSGGGYGRIPLTDKGWNVVAQLERARVKSFDRKRRVEKTAKHTEHWRERHAWAVESLIQNPQVNSLDTAVTIERRRQKLHQEGDHSRSVSDEAIALGNQVDDLFSRHCQRCHIDRQQGGLSLLSRNHLLHGGESGVAAVVPGNPNDGYLMELVQQEEGSGRMPPLGPGLTAVEIQLLRQWIRAGAWLPQDRGVESREVAGLSDDQFLRRVFVDVTGRLPTDRDYQNYYAERSEDRRRLLVDELLRRDDFADNLMGYWQDLLAENPNLLKPTQNNTGPFRRWLHDRLVDNLPADRLVTELIMMRGSAWDGGAAGFGVASQNDAPMAAKAHVLTTAFLGVDLKCARCHDAPYHQWTQQQLFETAAMLKRQPVKLSEGSTVPAAFFEESERTPLIQVSLKPGALLQPQWPFEDITGVFPEEFVRTDDSREQAAVRITASRRFAEVLTNRLWARLTGFGLVSPVDDWEANPPVYPELLSSLTDEFIRGGYDLRHLTRVIVLSDYYNHVAQAPREADRLAGPIRRRLTAEQVVDCSLTATGLELDTEPLTLDIEGTLPPDRFLNFGVPRRAWEFTTLANERDRPSLALPRAQAVVDVLTAFGWRDARPEPCSEREDAANLIQPALMANAPMTTWLTRLSDDHPLTELAISSESAEALTDSLFLRFLTRPPSSEERTRFVGFLSEGFANRIIPVAERRPSETHEQLPWVSWSNHLNTRANSIKTELEERYRKGPIPTNRLREEWRQRMEDAVWALLNSPEMVVLP